MKKIMPHVAGVFFALFGLGVVALLMSYTFEALAYIFPDNFVSQIMGMVLFDIAALAWLGAFIYLCKSVMQYAFAFIGFLFGLMGSLAMVAIDVMLGGQAMVEAPEWINSALVYGFIAAAVVHVILVYAYKLAGPEISADISLGIEMANITEEGMKQAEDELLRERGALGRVIAPRLMNNVKRNLGLPVSGDVIDLPAYDVNDMTQATPVQIPAERPMSFVERLKAAGQVLANPAPVARNSTPTRYEADTTAPSPQANIITPGTMRQRPTQPEKNVPVLSPERQRAMNTPDGKPGHTVGDVVKSGLCSCPPIVFDESRDQPFSDEVQKVLGEKTKGRGIACLRETGQQEVWLDESLCLGCPFYKQAQQADTATLGTNGLIYHPVGMQPTEDASQEKPAEVPQGDFFRGGKDDQG